MQTYKYELFTAGIEEQIKEGVLQSGDRLPSIREIKKKFHLSTSSVQSGYEYLMIRGWVESIPYLIYTVIISGLSLRTG